MKTIAFMLGILLVGNNASSQHIIEGLVLDTDKNPIPGVNILVDKTVLGTVTDYDGHFKLIIEDEPSMVLLIIRFTGYSSVDFEINMAKGYNYKLKASLEKGRNRKVKRNTPIEKVKTD